MMSGHLRLFIMTMYYTWLIWDMYRLLSRYEIKFYLVSFSSLLHQVTESSSPVTTSDYHDPAISPTLDQPLLDTSKNNSPVDMSKHAGTGRKVEQQKEIKVDKSLL